MAQKISFKKAFISRILGNSTNWPREMKILNGLVETYPESTFWDSLTIKFKIPSLAYFLTPKGAEIIRLEYKKFKFQPEEKIHYEVEESFDVPPSQPIIDTEKKTRVKSLNDFLKIWKK